MASIPSIPSAISADEGSAIKAACQKLVVGKINEYYPKVFVTYATGHRTDDAEGCGPGMYHAHWLIKQIAAIGTPCFSGLHVPPGEDWRMFLEKLGGPFSNARYLLVVLTPDLFMSKICLREINAAMEADVIVIPLLFESVTQELAVRWTSCGITEASPQEEKNWLTNAKPWFCAKNSQPSPGSVAYTSPELISDLLWNKVLPGERQRQGPQDGQKKIEPTNMGIDNVLRKILDGNSLRRSEAQMAFACFDKNGDGRISKSELETALNKLMNRKKDDVGWFVWSMIPPSLVDSKMDSARKAFKNADTNGDGVIDWEEFWYTLG